MKENKIIPKQQYFFINGKDEKGHPLFYVKELSEWESEAKTKTLYGDLISGKEFYSLVDDGFFIDYDGSMADVFINDCPSNLGLWHKGIHQGYFMVTGEVWLDICNHFDVKVHWCNK